VYIHLSVSDYSAPRCGRVFLRSPLPGLGKHTNEGSGFLIMMIMGGGFISLLQGWLAKDELLGIQWSYLTGVVCFAYLFYYGWKASQILKKQGIEYETSAAKLPPETAAEKQQAGVA
jgi:FHS family L-fucose permease-like MFS transporter